MILQALNDLYDRYPPGTLPPEGYEDAPISFLIVIDRDGVLVNIADIREGEGRRKHGCLKRVPQSCDRPGQGAWQTAFLLWDHPRYVLGITPNESAKESELAPRRLSSFIDRIKASFPDPSADEGVEAVLKFYERGGVDQAKRHPRFQELLESNGNIAFQLVSDLGLVAQRPAVVKRVAWEVAHPGKPVMAQCLVSGKVLPISRLHPATPVKGSQATAKIHSFNLDAFNSYGKNQGANAPVSEAVAFRYTTALNHLLVAERQRIQVGDASTVFWAETPHDLETMAPDLFGEPPKDDPDRGVDALKALYQSVASGKFTVGGASDRLHILGLAPNAARISIRFWEMATAMDLAQRLQRHFEDIRVARAPHDPEHLSLFRLLTACAVQNKADNIPPNLGGEVMRAILEGLPYPASLLNAAVQRCRAEQKVTYPRAAAIKGCLNRNLRHANRNKSHQEREFTNMLDTDNPNPAYRLGRLFAALEKIQEEASPGLNATIRDRYYGAASSTPVAVFTTLLRLKNHHLGKLTPGRTVQMERLLGEIMGGLSDFPRHLPLPEQGRFALGYYHQRQALFAKHDTQTTDNQEESK